MIDESTHDAGEIPNWVAGDALRPMQPKRFRGVPSTGAAETLRAACHSLIVAWVDEAARDNDEFIRWLGEAWEAVDQSQGQHGFLVATPDERLRDEFFKRAAALNHGTLTNCQTVSWEQFGERAARPAVASLLGLENARKLLWHGLNQPERKLQLFISHAKKDGLDLAHALQSSVKGIPYLDSFYDAVSISAGSNWKNELKKGVEGSVMIVVRTDEYDQRPACIEEVTWAERAGVPFVVVDARASLFMPPSPLPLGTAPWVRIPDGSLTRILYCALRENLGALLVRRGLHQLKPGVVKAIEFLSRAPTWDSLDGALERLAAKKTKQRFIVYPDPKLPPSSDLAVAGFVGRNGQTRVLNYSVIMAEKGAS